MCVYVMHYLSILMPHSRTVMPSLGAFSTLLRAFHASFEGFLCLYECLAFVFVLLSMPDEDFDD